MVYVPVLPSSNQKYTQTALDIISGSNASSIDTHSVSPRTSEGLLALTFQLKKDTSNSMISRKRQSTNSEDTETINQIVKCCKSSKNKGDTQKFLYEDIIEQQYDLQNFIAHNPVSKHDPMVTDCIVPPISDAKCAQIISYKGVD